MKTGTMILIFYLSYSIEWCLPMQTSQQQY